MVITKPFVCELKENRIEISHQNYNSDVFYDICDLNGKILNTGRLSQNASNTTINIKNFSSGVYQLLIVNEGSVFKKKLVV